MLRFFTRIYNHDSILDDSIDTVCGIEFHDVITEDEFEEPGSKILSNTEVASIDDDKAPSPSPTDQVKFSLSDEGKSKNGLEDSSTEDPEVYIANNLNDFLNVAPPIPTTDDPQTGHHDQPTLAEVNSVPMVKMSTVAARVEDASVTKPPQHGNRIGGPQPAYESTNAGDPCFFPLWRLHCSSKAAGLDTCTTDGCHLWLSMVDHGRVRCCTSACFCLD